jgi:hypothetical protein
MALKKVIMILLRTYYIEHLMEIYANNDCGSWLWFNSYPNIGLMNAFVGNGLITLSRELHQIYLSKYEVEMIVFKIEKISYLILCRNKVVR